jgi:hypothetical protein
MVMANNYLQTSFVFECGSTENAAIIMNWINRDASILKELQEVIAKTSPDAFAGQTDDDDFETDDGTRYGTPNWHIADASLEGDTCLWISIVEGGDIEILASILLYAMRTMTGVLDRQGFTWAETCSSMRVDEFTGGAVFISKDDGCEWLVAADWWQALGVRIGEGERKLAV